MRLLSLSAGLAVSLTLWGIPGHATAQIEGVATVVDGDTIEIGGKKIRLSGYDTPEPGKRCGETNVSQQATLALSEFIGRSTVTCIPTGARNRDRVVATCSVRGVDFGDYMVSSGWGRDWPLYSNGKYCTAEKLARSEQQAIWGMSCPSSLWSGRNYDGCM